jgi:nitroreductase
VPVETRRPGQQQTPNLSDDSFIALVDPPTAALPVDYRMLFALHAAVVAPSVHNTQPWRFRFHPGPQARVDLLMDVGRGLPALDPTHRQLVISCGAALEAYSIGLRSVGLAPEIEILPAGDPLCLATIRVTDLGSADPQAVALLPALVRRRSYRGRLTFQPVGQALVASMAQAAAPAASLDPVPQASWRAVEHLIAQAALELAETPAVEAEVKTWTRLTERSQDGVAAANWQRTSEQTAGAPVVQRDFAQGRPLPGGPTVVAQPEGDPLLAVLLTPGDTSADWVDAGRSLMRVALVAQSAGLAQGYVNQPTEVVGMREKLAVLLRLPVGGFSVPQLVLRLGYPAQPLPPATARRSVQAVLTAG